MTLHPDPDRHRSGKLMPSAPPVACTVWLWAMLLAAAFSRVGLIADTATVCQKCLSGPWHDQSQSCVACWHQLTPACLYWEAFIPAPGGMRPRPRYREHDPMLGVLHGKDFKIWIEWIDELNWLSRSFPALPGLLVVVQVPGYASVISIGAGRSPAKFLSQAAGGAYRRGDAAASAIQGRMAFKNGGTFLVLILKHRHHARQEQGYGQTTSGSWYIWISWIYIDIYISTYIYYAYLDISISIY